MKLIINGKPHEADSPTLAGVMAELGYQGDYHATAVNREFVPRGSRDRTRLNDGDRVEILTPRQGG